LPDVRGQEWALPAVQDRASVLPDVRGQEWALPAVQDRASVLPGARDQEWALPDVRHQVSPHQRRAAHPVRFLLAARQGQFPAAVVWYHPKADEDHLVHPHPARFETTGRGNYQRRSRRARLQFLRDPLTQQRHPQETIRCR